MRPDFEKYSIVLRHNGADIFTSAENRLKPLLECILKFKGKVECCVLYDRVIGLAAAKLVIQSGIISSIETPLASIPALDEIAKTTIGIQYDQVVENIMARDGATLCPMEQRALSQPDNEAFFMEMVDLIKI